MKSKEERRKKRALSAAKLLNLFIGDLGAARQGFSFIDKISDIAGDVVDEDYWKSMHRMHLSHIAITFFKVCEVYNLFNDVIPDGEKELFKNLYKFLADRGAPSLRNKFFCHILDKETKEPIDNDVLNGYIEDFIEGDLEEFFSWTFNGKDSVLNQMEIIRNSIIREHGFSKGEVGNMP